MRHFNRVARAASLATVFAVFTAIGCDEDGTPTVPEEPAPAVGAATVTLEPFECRSYYLVPEQPDTISARLDSLCVDSLTCRAYFDRIDEEYLHEGMIELSPGDTLIARYRVIRTSATHWEFDDDVVAAVLGPMLEGKPLFIQADYGEQGGSSTKIRMSVDIVAADFEQPPGTPLIGTGYGAYADAPPDGDFPWIPDVVSYDGSFLYFDELPDHFDRMIGPATVHVENLRSIQGADSVEVR